MRQRENQVAVARLNEKRLLDVTELCLYLSIGRNRGSELAREIGAEVRIGKRVLFDREVIDKWVTEQVQDA